jgi:hypothetical protein
MELEQGGGLRDASARRGSGVTGTVPRVLTTKRVGRRRNQEELLSRVPALPDQKDPPRLETPRLKPRSNSNKARLPSRSQKNHNFNS